MNEDGRIAEIAGKDRIHYDDNGAAAPISSVPTASSAKVIYERMRKAHVERAYTFARIQGMIDGNPPFSKKALQRSGLLSNSNVNWRDAESIYESVALAYWSLFNDVDSLVKFETDIADPNANPQIAEIVSEEWTKAMKRWDKFPALMSQHQGDLIKFGSSMLIWPDERDWRFDVADVWRTLVPERSRNHVDFLGVVAVEHIMTAQELWTIYEKASEKHWNKEELAKILVYTSGYNTEKKEYSGQYFAELQRIIRNGDVQIEDIYSDDIMMVSMLIREYDGGISRGIFHPDLDGEHVGAWTYFADRQYDEMNEAVQLFTFTPGERFFHGNKGMGHRVFNVVEGITHVDNSVMDSVRRSSTVLVRNRATRNRDPKKLVFNYGGLTDIGEAEFVQNLIGANLAPQVEVAQYFRSKMETNNNISGASMRTPDGKPRTLGEVQVLATREARVQKNRIAHYYDQLDILFRNLIRKQLRSKEAWPGNELVSEWKDACIKRGVPEEFFVITEDNVGENGLPVHMTIHATRASGSGSQVADQIEMQTIMQILPTLGERGREAALQDFIAAFRGHPYVSRYFPPEDRTKQPVGDDTIASIENNQLEKGEMVVVSPDNNHAVHAPRHIQRMQQIAEAFNEAESAARQQGAQNPQIEAEQHGQYSLEETDIAFQTLGPHFVRHLLFLQQDPTRRELAQSLAAQWAILANFGDKIANNAQEHRTRKLREVRQQQEQLESMSAEERVKMAAVEVDARIKMLKLQKDIERGATRDQLEFLLQRQKVSFEQEIERAKAAAEIAKKSVGEETTGRKPNELF